jgi:hypothetical protein
VGGSVEEHADLASCHGCVRRRVDVLLSVCGSLCRGDQLQLLGLYVVDDGVEASLISFEGVIVVGEGGEAGTLVVKFAEDRSKGGSDTFPPLIFLGQHDLGCSRLVTGYGVGL